MGDILSNTVFLKLIDLIMGLIRSALKSGMLA